MNKLKSAFAIVIILQVILHLANAQSDSFVAFLPKSGECGQLNKSHLYNENSNTALEEFPWIGRVKYYTKRAVGQEVLFLCSATLISRRHLLSVAHCYTNVEQNEPISVVLGDWNTTNNITEIDCTGDGVCAPAPPQEYQIDEVILIPESIENVDHDLAVLRLASDVVFMPHIQPICLPLAAVRNDDFVTQYLSYSGFSKEEPNKVKLLAHVMSLNSCSVRYRIKLSDNYICAACTSTAILLSGSPLMGISVENAEPRGFYLMGISSRGAKSCTTTMPDVFVNVWQNLDWIKTNIY